MKKLMIALLMGMSLCPANMEAFPYKVKHSAENSNPKPRVPALNQISVYMDEYTGDLYIYPNYDITGLTVTIEQGGVVYEEATVTLAAGQAYTSTVADYAQGDYTLTLTDGDDNVIDQYIITVEDN